MQSSLSKAELNARRAGEALIVECLDPRALSEVLVELVAREPSPPKALLVDMSRVEMIRGEGLEAIMQLREQSSEQGVILGLVHVSFYIEQLLAVLEMSEQMPLRYTSFEEATASLAKQGVTMADTRADAMADAAVVDDAAFQFELESASRAETQRMSALPAQALLPSGAEDFLAVDFSDFQAPRKTPSEEGFEISLDGELAFADTDKFTGKDLRAASSGIVAARATEVLPAFSDLDSDSDSDSDSDIVDAFDDDEDTAVDDGQLVSGLESLLAVDFDDYGAAAGSDRDTPPEGVAAKDSSDFQIDFEEDFVGGNLVTPARREAALPFPAAQKDTGYSPVGSLPASGRPPLPETKVFDPTQLGLGSRSGGLSESLAYMETQEIAVPKGLLGELEAGLPGSDDDSEDDNQDAIATQVMPAIRPKFPIGAGPASPPAPVMPMNLGSGGFGGDDDDQGMIMAPGSFMAGASSDLMDGDGEETMLLNVNSLNLAAHLAALDAAASQMTGGNTAAGPSAAERAQAERAKAEAEQQERERAEAERLERERLERERLAEERRRLEEERKQLEELAAAREAERIRYEAEMKRAQEEERKKLEAELLALRERERERLEAEIKRAQEEERKRFEEELRKAQEAERERLRREMEEAREASRKQMEEELRKVQEAERKRLEEETRQVQEAERKRLEEELRRVQDEERQRLAEEARRVQEAERKRLEEELRRAQDEERKRLAEEARRLQEENERRAREESERKAREEADRLARAETERLIEAERQARVEAERLIEAERQARAQAERKVEEERLAREAAERAADLVAAQQAAVEAEEKARAARAKVETAKSEAARAASASGSSRRRGGKTKFKDWFKNLGPGEDPSGTGLKARRGEIRSFCEAKGISSPLAVKLLGILQGFRNKALGEEELARQVEANEREVAGALAVLVAKRLIRRSRAPRLANSYGFKIAGSPKDRNQVRALVQLTENGQTWPIKG